MCDVIESGLKSRRGVVMEMYGKPALRATTVLGVIRNGKAALGSDGQMTLGNTVIKHSTKKIRRLRQADLITGFAGATADAVTLLDRFEEKLQAYGGQLERAAVELARDWRTDKYLRRLEAMLAVVGQEKALIISGTGDVIEPEDGIVAIGSGSMFALASARSLLKHTDLEASDIVRESLKIAADICIYTNDHIILEEV
jgi:ATP-dependent HslUV protease subunit HslV